MTYCKFCDEPITWERDYYQDRWIPMESGTGERHSCRNREWEPEPVECQYCGDDIVFKKRMGMDGLIKWRPYDPDTNVAHDCPERKQAWLEEQSQRTGRSEAVLCRNGCGTLIFWDYDRRSKFSKKPLPFEKETDTLHKCLKYKYESIGFVKFKEKYPGLARRL